MLRIFTHIKDRLQGKVPAGSKRSPQWPGVRKAHLAKNPLCALCGSKKKVEVHHIKPFHLNPHLELEPSNLITLCENKTVGKLICHLVFGHLGDYRSFNENVIADVQSWNQKIANRPKPGLRVETHLEPMNETTVKSEE